MFYKANDQYNSNLTAGYTVGQTTLSVADTPENVPTIVTVGFGTDKETVFSVTGKALGTLTGVARLRGYNGNIDAQTAITCLNNEEFINQAENVVSTPETLAPILYGVDGGSNDSYIIALDVQPTSLVPGMIIYFKANTANTGACTLKVNDLDPVEIKKGGSDTLNDNDIKAGQIIQVDYDGTYFQLIGGNTVKATNEEISAGTEDNKFITPLQLAEAGFVLDTDLTENSDLRVPTQKAVKTAIDGKVINRAFVFGLSGGVSTGDEQGMKYIVPQGMTVVGIKHKTGSGTATIRLQKDTTTIDESISVTSSVATETTITSPALTAGQVLTLDVTAVSSCVDLFVTVECTQP